MVRAISAALALVACGCGHVSSIEEDASADSDADSDTDAAGCVAGGNWYDTATALCWQNPPSTDMLTWDEVVAYCEGLSLGDYDDWRLPLIQELMSLLRGCVNGTATGDLSASDCGVSDPDCLEYSCWGTGTACITCEIAAGPDDDPAGCYWDPALAGTCWAYWSSSSYAYDVSYAWGVDFNGGYVVGLGKSGTFYARCVRGGP